MIIDYFFLGRIAIFSSLFFCDLMLTYFFMLKYRQIYPEDKQWYESEGSFVLRWCWKKWGLNKGTFFGAIFVYPLICLLILFTRIDFVFGMVIGVYLMVFTSNIYILRRLFTDGKKID